MLKNKDSIKHIFLQREEYSGYLKIHKIIAISALYDLALIETKAKVPNYLKIKSIFQSKDKSFILGYPAGSKLKKIKKMGPFIPTNFVHIFPVNYSELDGSSGSPVLNQEG